jgi:hypothetical protein
MAGLAHILTRAVERLAIWLISTGIAFVPAISGARTRPSTDFFSMLWKINLSGFFRDVFFVAIILAIVGITNLIDNILRKEKLPHPLFRVGAWLAFSYFILLVVYGTYAFTIIPLHASVAAEDFYVDAGVIIGAMIAGSVTEVLIAMAE